jgi:hypothetical protein
MLLILVAYMSYVLKDVSTLSDGTILYVNITPFLRTVCATMDFINVSIMILLKVHLQRKITSTTSARYRRSCLANINGIGKVSSSGVSAIADITTSLNL